MPKISIIIPAYNVEEYIKECLDSILNQTFTDYEVIVVDDCSTDNTYSIIESYIPKFNNKLTLLKTDKNSGTCSIPRNIGLPLAKGEYIYFLDADDYISHNALEILYNTAKEYNADDVYASSYLYVVSDRIIQLRDVIGQRCIINNITDKLQVLTNKDNYLDRAIIDYKFSHSTCVHFVRREFLVDNNITFYPILAEDLIWSIEIFARAKTVVRIIEPVYYYRIHNGSITRRSINSRGSFIKETETFLKSIDIIHNLSEKIDYIKRHPIYIKGYISMYWNIYIKRTINYLKEQDIETLYKIYLRLLSKENNYSNLSIAFFLSLLVSSYSGGENNVS